MNENSIIILTKEEIIEGIEKLREKVDDFASYIEPAYWALKWTWASTYPRPPYKTDIVRLLNQLLDSLVEAPEIGDGKTSQLTVSSGGLEVGFYVNYFHIKFCKKQTIGLPLERLQTTEEL
jgi:hypothetical protein